jgi:hypothetical protein
LKEGTDHYIVQCTQFPRTASPDVRNAVLAWGSPKSRAFSATSNRFWRFSIYEVHFLLIIGKPQNPPPGPFIMNSSPQLATAYKPLSIVATQP